MKKKFLAMLKNLKDIGELNPSLEEMEKNTGNLEKVQEEIGKPVTLEKEKLSKEISEISSKKDAGKIPTEILLGELYNILTKLVQNQYKFIILPVTMSDGNIVIKLVLIPPNNENLNVEIDENDVSHFKLNGKIIT